MFEITTGRRTMFGLIGELTGQPFVLPVMLTGNSIGSHWKCYNLKFPCCSVMCQLCYQYVCVLQNFDLKSWVKCNCCLQLMHWNRHWGSPTSIEKIKIFSLLLVKQRLFSGLLIGCGKKGKFRGIFRVRFTEKLANFTGILHKFFSPT